MPKKSTFILTLVAVLVLAITTAAFAKSLKIYIEGEIIAINDPDPGTMIILTEEGEEITIFLPEDFDDSMFEVGMFVVVKGIWVDEGFEATWVEEVDPEGGGGDREGKGGVYCSDSKDDSHPVAEKIASMYEADGVTPEWVMDQFCAGFGFGEIMLALKTQALIGEEGDDFLFRTQVILSMRSEMGWGQIWKELGLTKNDKDSNPPPGWLKKPDKKTNPPPGWEKKPDKHSNLPPGWEKKPHKVKGP